MARPRLFRGSLTEEEKAQLTAIANSRTEEVRRSQRARIILAGAAGASNEQIAKDVQLSTVTVGKILKKWTLFGVNAALEDLCRTGRPPVIGEDAKAWIVSLGCRVPKDLPDGPHMQQWTISELTKYIRNHCSEMGFPALKGVQTSTVWETLNGREVKPHRMKYYLVKKDNHFKEHAEPVLLLYKRVEWVLQWVRDDIANGRRADELCGEVFISYDEKPGIQAIANIAPDRSADPNKGYGTMARDYEYKRLGTVSLLAGIDLLNGEVTGLVRDTHSSVDFIDFLKELDAKYSGECTINVILDNHSVHKSRAVLDFLATMPGRFRFTFTPKHASWLNLIESFFSKLAKQALRGLRVKSKQELVEHILGWIKDTNEERVVYRWEWRLEDIESAFDNWFDGVTRTRATCTLQRTKAGDAKTTTIN